MADMENSFRIDGVFLDTDCGHGQNRQGYEVVNEPEEYIRPNPDDRPAGYITKIRCWECNAVMRVLLAAREPNPDDIPDVV